MDTCDDCIRQLHAERYRSARPAGGDSGRPNPRIVSVYPAPVFAQVYNEATGTMRWFEVHQDSLIELLDRDLQGPLD